MSDVLSSPAWLITVVGITLALVAPWIVGALQAVLEERLRRRTLDTIARAMSTRAAQYDRHHEG